MNVELIFDIIQSISIIIASIVAIIGINSWRNEAKWKRRYELTSNVLKSFYEAKEAIDYVRFPGGYKSEGNTRKRNKEKSIRLETNLV